MNTIIKASLAGLAAFTFGTAAQASTVIATSCDPVTDGDSAGCRFSGNINANTNAANVNSHKNAEAAYNVWAVGTGNPTITLNWITSTDAADFSNFGTFTGAGQTSGTFSLPGWDIDYFAVKASNEFVLYEYIGSNTWTTGNQHGVSHIAFFGTQAPAVPEPGTWAMMLLGFAGAGVAIRRSRRRGGELLQVA